MSLSRADADLVARDPALPALAMALDRGLLAERLCDAGIEVTRARAARLRYKPGRSVQAALVVHEAESDRRTWWLLAAYGDAYSPKAAKDLAAAGRAGLRYGAGPGWVCVPVAADRALPRARGWLTRGGREVLAYNPRRRLVTLDRRAGTVHKLYATSSETVVSPWVRGRGVDPARDGAAMVRALADLPSSLVRPYAGSVPFAPARPDLLDQLWRRGDRALGSASALLPELTPLAAEVRARLPSALAALKAAPLRLAHGDLSPDQAVLDDTGRVWVVDTDDIGLWPAEWDHASWQASQVAVGAEPVALPGRPCPAPALLAAALVLRCTEPFARRRPQWAQLSTAMLARAAGALGTLGPRSMSGCDAEPVRAGAA